MKVQQFTTISGSVYQFDGDNRQVRRVRGFHPVTGRQSPEGYWQFFHWCTPDTPERGELMFFDWDGEGHGTNTSIVTKVEDIELPDDYAWGEN